MKMVEPTQVEIDVGEMGLQTLDEYIRNQE
jgi:hypothetical protein